MITNKEVAELEKEYRNLTRKEGVWKAFNEQPDLFRWAYLAGWLDRNDRK